MNNFTNNFTKPEALPKTGHVNEVCKEWLVREDGALAYKLQSQEITDFYKGNRLRNAVVREDFPTALHEQIKEKEHADKQVEAYRRRLLEQEEHDKRVANEIADKLERDLQEQQRRELLESEMMAQQMQEIYVNLPPAPPPASRERSRPPPRPAKASTLQNTNETASTSPSSSSSLAAAASNSSRYHSSHNHQHPHQPPLQLQQQHFSNENGYVGLSLGQNVLDLPAAAPQRQRAASTNANNLLKLSPEKYDQLVGNDLPGCMRATVAVDDERHMQQHADDIELYVDPCDYASLREIGLPMEEIKEMSKKLKQEQKDELLARRLQEMEVNDGLTQEDRDRLLAIEAQDKELAKMLQEREKAKAKRAKEKARLRKSQQKDTGSTLCSTSNGGLHCGPLLPLPQDCLFASKQHHFSTANSKACSQAQDTLEDALDLEAYSNPIDIIHSQRMQNGNGTFTNGSLTRDSTANNRHGGANSLHSRDDDIYTLPVDSCRPGQRPASMHIGSESGPLQVQHNSMTRSENYSIDSHDTMNGHDVPPRMNYSTSGSFDQSSSPTPPYMPIQGTRRSNSSDDRKKKSKDKCTHQ